MSKQASKQPDGRIRDERDIRVCHITSAHPVLDTRILYKECRSLAGRGFDVYLVAPTDSDADISEAKSYGVQVVPLPRSRSRFYRFTRTVWLAYRKALALDAAIYHIHDPELVLAGLLLRMGGRRVIYDVHEDTPRALLSPGREYLPACSKRLVSRLFECLENFSAATFTGCITATPAIQERFRNVQPDVCTVSNFPIIEELVLPERTAWGDRDNAVAYVGGIELPRGLYQMVDALRRIPEELGVRLRLAGKFAESSSFRADIIRMDGWSSVDELGFLARTDVAKLLDRVRAGLVLLHPEPRFIVSQPIKLYEYMSAGIPVIASNFPAWSDLIEGEGCGLVVDPLDPQAIAEAIEYVIRHPEEAEEMGKRGRSAVETEYNWNNEAEKLIGAYDKCFGLKH